jgi:8-hydroxy-5-deazaflavin:NADPH oxidoreductase
MNVGVLGTGVVGSAIGSRLVGLGQEVRMGSREAGNENARAWADEAGSNASEGTFADAAAFGELLFNCTKLYVVRWLKLWGVVGSGQFNIALVR